MQGGDTGRSLICLPYDFGKEKRAMEDPKARMTTNLSNAEMERRWKAVREVMRERQVDFLIMRNDEEFLGGYVRWFSDFPPASSYPLTVIFPFSDEMTLISCGGVPPAESRLPSSLGGAWGEAEIVRSLLCVHALHQHAWMQNWRSAF